MLIDTHCHIHESEYPLDVGDVMKNAHEAGVAEMICVGTSIDSSRRALAFAPNHEGVYASIGVHPHDTKDGYRELFDLVNANETPSKLVAIGEIGLDYFYTHSPRVVQIEALEVQLDFARRLALPVIFHVRDAFEDFWPIFDNFSGLRGELHSFTDTQANLEKALQRGLYIGVNGISTFTKDEAQRELFGNVPVDSLLFETDAPFLTPVPYRGKVNEPAFVRAVAEHHASLRSVTLDEISRATTANARALFAL